MEIKSIWDESMAKAGVLLAGGLITAWFAAGCASGVSSDEGVTCGAGTVQQGDECVADDSNGGGDDSSSGVASGSCISAATRSCYGGPAGTQGVGVCLGGTQTCVGDSWGPCVGEALPSAEACNGIDDDCNGKIDEACGSIGKASYQTAPGYFDAVLDTERDQVFLSYGGSGVVHVIGLQGGSDKVVTTGWSAEYMHFDPILDQVAISLPSGMHSAYWWDNEQTGYVGAINAISLVDPTPIWIPLDLWQIVSDGTGTVYAAGASGQWTHAIAVNLKTNASTLSTGQSVRNGTSIRIHPSLKRIYGADTGLSPSDIERWDIVAGTVNPSYDSPYHGTYPMCGDLRIHPAGDTIYTKCGHVFLASNVQATDMTWVGNMGLTWKDLAFHPSSGAVYAITDKAPLIHVYDSATLMPVTTSPLSAPAERILAGPTYLVLIRSLLGGSPKTQIEVIPYTSL